MSDYFKNAYDRVADSIAHIVGEASANALREACKATLRMSDTRYSAFTEYGKPPIQGDVIDSTAVVIDDNTKALPEPKE